MIVAAGIMILAEAAQGDVTLFLLRGNGSDYPLTWAFPGGQAEAGETTAACAIRETEEECGLRVDDVGPVWTRGIAPAQQVPAQQVPADNALVAPPSEDVDFTTYLHRVAKPFVPELCDEHVGWCWAPPGQPPLPLHPGASVALERLTMNELGLARAMAAGRLVSPQRYMNVWLFNLRITGTGMSYRKGRDEKVWRDPATYLNEEFLARCNGLQVIWVHPDKATLDSKEFNERTIGSVFLPYIRGEDVWAIAKVYDDEAAEDMILNQLSTSPTVVLSGEDDLRFKSEDGSALLIEGEPRLLDHVAICPAGVWDKIHAGGTPVGVDRSAAELPVADELVVADSYLAVAHNGGKNFELRALAIRARAQALKFQTQARTRAS
jgi:8-oxo-dGTP pyrophosphatase MutT (NUDIX family)